MNDLNGKPCVEGSGQRRIAVLLTCFNRRALTLRCLQALFDQELQDATLQVFLVDDASSDGTAEAILESFPQVRVTRGSGELYWNRGMHLAFSIALQEHFDYYLWANDDTVLRKGAIALLLETAGWVEVDGPPAIVTGSTADATTGAFTYGGIRWRSRWMPPLFRHVHPGVERPVACATMNGNCTLIPRAIVEAIGILDPHFRHNFGDMDYGLRATEAGFGVYAAPGFIGTCSENSYAGTWLDTGLSLRRRWELMQTPKGSPWREWSYFARRHMGPFWLVYALAPYVKLVLGGAR